MKRTAIYSLLVLAFSILLLSNPALSQQGIRSGLAICTDAILPVLFPFFVITELLISWGFTRWLEQHSSPWMHALFHLSGSAASAWILGTLGGYPVGVKTVASLYQSKTLSKEEAQHCTMFMNNAGPGFIIGIAGNLLLHSVRAGLLLWFIHLTASVSIGILFRPPNRKDSKHIFTEAPTARVLPAISSAIGKSGEIALMVCTFVLFFSILSAWVSMIFPHTYNTALCLPVLIGTIELTSGITGLSSISMSNEILFVAASFLLGWGGLCIHGQSTSILNKAGLSSKIYLAGKALHSLVSLALACLFAPLLYADSFSLFSIVLHIAPLLLIARYIVLLPKTTSGKPSPNRI